MFRSKDLPQGATLFLLKSLLETSYWFLSLYTVAQKESPFFKNNFNFFIFNIKKIMLTPKQPVINAVLITYIDYPITENYIGKMASFLPYTRPEPLHKVLHHIY